MRSKRGLTRLGGRRNRAVRAASAATVRFARLPWLAALVALVACWTAPATHADERDDPATVTAAGASAGQPAIASETTPSGAASGGTSGLMREGFELGRLVTSRL